ncbi:MAG: pyrrolo-quinoline quinone [Flavobacterium sp.]|nr:MAG: pyrrolo-quinoline quinone [Flavobacterium sp.]
MKKNLLTILFAFSVINMFGQVPVTSTTVSDPAAPVNDKVTNKVISPLAKVPLYDNGVLIYDYDGNLFSFDLDSEQIVWTVKATDHYTEMCANQVTLHDGVLYVPFINGEIFAIDNQSGDVFWKSRIGTITDKIVLKNQAPVINNNKLYITAQNGFVYALNLKDGSLAWNYKLDSSNNDIPVLFFDNKIFTQSGTNFYSFDANTGKMLSQRSFEETIYGKPVTDGQNVFVANEKDVVFALGPNKLDVIWKFKVDENQNNIKERILCKDNKLYLGTQGSAGSSAYAVDSKTGTQLWKTDFKEDNILYITEHNDNIWGYTRKGKLFQLDIENGTILYEAKLTTLPISNLEFPDEESVYYYCDAGLIQFDFKGKDENMTYMRTSIKDDIYSAFIKIIR